VITSRESLEEELDELRTKYKKDERLMEFKEELKSKLAEEREQRMEFELEVR